MLKRWRIRILLFLAVLGPGFITANIDNDSGGILTYDGAGPARVRFTRVNPRSRCVCGAFERAIVRSAPAHQPEEGTR